MIVRAVAAVALLLIPLNPRDFSSPLRRGPTTAEVIQLTDETAGKLIVNSIRAGSGSLQLSRHKFREKCLINSVPLPIRGSSRGDF